eukprot:2077083-Pyramimonas_sp.AAC.1
MAISKIFGLGKPGANLPFLLSLAVDVAQSKDILLKSARFQHLRLLFRERPRPSATRFFYALSECEDDELQR